MLLTLYTSADGGATWQEFFGTPTYAVSGENKWHVESDTITEGSETWLKVTNNYVIRSQPMRYEKHNHLF
ncbi:MAG: hypothetical protein SOX25_07325 [Eubacteriales bacterium]|nr:hypothetical protein [Eubacteriales bacterium]